MKNKILLYGFVVLLIGAVLFAYQQKQHKTQESKNKAEKSSQLQFTLPKKIRYTVEVNNPTNQLQTSVPVYISVPGNTSHQQIVKTDISLPHEIQTDTTGNQTAKLILENLVPYETRMINISVQLQMAEKPNLVNENDIERYTKAARYIESDNPKIKKMAQNLAKDKNKDTAKATLDWVLNHLKYAGFIAEDRGALYALENKTGDCTEYMSLYSALLRANKIPVKNVGGFIVESNKRLQPAEYHNWVEVYLDGAWRIVDPQNNKFLENESHYIVMRYIDDTVTSWFDNSQQLIKAEGPVTIAMQGTKARGLMQVASSQTSSTAEHWQCTYIKEKPDKNHQTNNLNSR